MKPILPLLLRLRTLSCWNWKCALLSATVRSLIYLVAMLHPGTHDRLAVLVVEMGYVTLTAGLWAGLQQRALAWRAKRWGNLVIVVVVPGCSQLLDYLAHGAAGAAAPARALLAAGTFTLLSALFHLYIMRRGVFLAGTGCSLAEDFRRLPRLLAGLALRPLTPLSASALKLVRSMEQEAAI